MSENKEKRHNLTALDAVRLLCNAIQETQYLDREGEGLSLPCKDHGELMLCDALQYLGYGDTRGARALMQTYDEWVATGDAPWPFDGSKRPPSADKSKDHAEKRERGSTVYSDSGTTVFVRLRVDREAYEFARHWAHFHAQADPQGTAEDHLEGYLNSAMAEAMQQADWVCPPEIRALYSPQEPAGKTDTDDGFPI